MCNMSWIGVILLGTLDFHVHAISSSDQSHLWSVKLNDSVLCLVVHETCSSLYAALADGCIAVIQVCHAYNRLALLPLHACLQSVSSSAPVDDPLFVRIGSSASVQAMVLNEGKRELWCGCGKSVTVISSRYPA